MTTKTNATLLVLAGGLGSRYKGRKQVAPMGPSGECLMEYSIYDAKNAGFNQLVLVINDYFNQETKDYFQSIADKADIKLDFIVQALDTLLPEKHRDKLTNRVKPWGTGHAILIAKDVIKNPFVVINADDYYNRKAFEKAYLLIKNGQINEGQYGMVAYPLSATLSDNGSVSRGVCTIQNGFLKKVVEHTNIAKENGIIFHTDTSGNKTELVPSTPVSMNFWILDTSIFKVLEAEFDHFLTHLSSEKAELFIPFVIDDMIHQQDLKVIAEASEDKWFGVTYPEDKDFVIKSVREMVDSCYYPASLW
ncbi:dTDP-glucose pyrophosphorylase [Elizabethkingia argentiflava]|uniref:dTDP-glucose pyrophosphorylase n=1 Tax=Elizabethkingia argenteiflava TaxID=2681556 RepID=A0A845PWY7_9FLAO|nr:sugar phosphate nucleotidyltransferase [Elizabethkingia argenteiflava]NAW51723.1 dTDP-glucose pyrophosphorylase [Elizabethkingia argenteiflava]